MPAPNKLCRTGMTTEGLYRLLAWAGETATGDRADLAELPDDSALWRDVQATPETRIGARCVIEPDGAL